MRSAHFPIDSSLHREREREQEKERLCPSVKCWKQRNGTISVIQDLHISLLIGVCIERERKRERARERETMSICEMVKTQKWYYLHNTRSAYFPINSRLHERGREREREMCETVKTQSAREREQEERESKRERLCPSVKW